MDSFERKLDKFMANLIATRKGMQREAEAGGPNYGAASRFLDITAPVVIELVREHYQFHGSGLDNQVVRNELNFDELKKLSIESKEKKAAMDVANPIPKAV